MPTQAGVAPAERERGEAGKRKTDCDDQQGMFVLIVQKLSLLRAT